MRLFVGLEIPDTIKAHVALLMSGVAGARWQTADQLHITLRFIGEVGQSQLLDINSALGRILMPGFQLHLRSVDVFGEPTRPRMVWAGVEPQGPVQHLRDKVEQALVRTGLEAETRKYKPHLTLARFGREKPRRLADYLAGNTDFTSASFPVTEFVLFESLLGHTGSTYVPLERYALEGPNKERAQPE